MNIDKSKMSERLHEVRMMCDRHNPVYEQISNYSLALYALGCFDDTSDFMDIEDLDVCQASEILKENFELVDEKNIPYDYEIDESKERYLLVLGDPLFPQHFAAVTDIQKEKPFFSKYRYMGSGYDNLEELMMEYSVEEKMGSEDIHYFRKIL